MIGRVGFDFDFQGGSSTEAQHIIQEWNRSVNQGMEKSAFIAGLVLNTFPFLAYLPNKDIEKMGEIKRTTLNIASKIYERKEAYLEDGKQMTENDFGFSGKDLLTSLMLANKAEKGGLSKERILDNVSHTNFWPYLLT